MSGFLNSKTKKESLCPRGKGTMGQKGSGYQNPKFLSVIVPNFNTAERLLVANIIKLKSHQVSDDTSITIASSSCKPHTLSFEFRVFLFPT